MSRGQIYPLEDHLGNGVCLDKDDVGLVEIDHALAEEVEIAGVGSDRAVDTGQIVVRLEVTRDHNVDSHDVLD